MIFLCLFSFSGSWNVKVQKASSTCGSKWNVLRSFDLLIDISLKLRFLLNTSWVVFAASLYSLALSVFMYKFGWKQPFDISLSEYYYRSLRAFGGVVSSAVVPRLHPSCAAVGSEI